MWQSMLPGMRASTSSAASHALGRAWRASRPAESPARAMQQNEASTSAHLLQGPLQALGNSCNVLRRGRPLLGHEPSQARLYFTHGIGGKSWRRELPGPLPQQRLSSQRAAAVISTRQVEGAGQRAGADGACGECSDAGSHLASSLTCALPMIVTRPAAGCL